MRHFKYGRSRDVGVSADAVRFLQRSAVRPYSCPRIPMPSLPANQWLEKDVREVWLHSCIQYGIRNCWFAEGEARSVYLGWLQFEQEYVANFFPKGWGSRGSTGMDQFTTRLCGHALFWQITF